jgi:hypothetical protein
MAKRSFDTLHPCPHSGGVDELTVVTPDHRRVVCLDNRPALATCTLSNRPAEDGSPMSSFAREPGFAVFRDCSNCPGTSAGRVKMLKEKPAATEALDTA